MIEKQCPACGRKRGVREIDTSIYECPKCHAIFGKCYLGESYKYVLPYFTKEEPKETRYFDFLCLSSKGIIRRHGWFDVATRRIVQVG